MQAEVEVKVERRSDSCFLSLDLSLNLPIALADFFSILLVAIVEAAQNVPTNKRESFLFVHTMGRPCLHHLGLVGSFVTYR